MPELVQQLPDGPIDFIGDVHGELEALQRLLAHLGYRPDGSHAAGRHLVFLGDLVDRGPDSPAVALLVRELVANHHASCILGNHEMNAMLGKKRTYNRFDKLDPTPMWFLVSALRTMHFDGPNWLGLRTLVPNPISIQSADCCVVPRSPRLRVLPVKPSVHHGGKPITVMIVLVFLVTIAGSFWRKEPQRKSRDASIHLGP